MNVSIEFFILLAFTYLLSSLSTAIIVCRLMGLPDPRSHGSKNPGATNVLRYGGKKAAAITLAGDALKGLIPVLVARLFLDDPAQLAVIGTVAFLGHLYPVFFGFKGGKGVATAFGVFMGMSWLVGLALLATWLTVAFVFRISSLSAIIAALLAPLYFRVLEPHTEWFVMAVVVSVILLWRHRSNIQNLLSGREGKINEPDGS